MELIRPMLATPSTSSGNRQPVSLEYLAGRGDYVAQEKLDGLRAILYASGGTVRLLNRSVTDVTERFPEIARLNLPDMVLDGEIVADDGTFSTVATRGKQARRYEHAAKAMPCHFVAFDLLRLGDTDLTRTHMHARSAAMRKVVGTDPLLRPVVEDDDLMRLWERVVLDGGEGIIAKQRTSIYLPGARAASWIKFKAVQRITAIAIGYEKGERREFGAIHLALLDDGKPLSIGRVGTGWTEKQAAVLKARLDAGEMFPVEIEALNRTKDNLLRFPVYRGERTDLGLEAATADQLAHLRVY